METEIKTDICCPAIDPAHWEGQEQNWIDKVFVQTKVFCLMYMPVNFGGKMRKIMPVVDKAGVEVPDGMVLSVQTSPWNMELYIAVDKAVPGLKHTTLTGKFISKVYEGPYKNVGKWYKEFPEWVKEQGHEAGKIYVWYAYCPGCAKKFGKNYMVFFAEI